MGLCCGAVVRLLWPPRAALHRYNNRVPVRHGASAVSIYPSCYMAAIRTLSYPLCLFGLYLDLNICAAKIVCRHQEQVNVWAGLCILISKAVIMVTSHTQLSTNQRRGRWSGDQLWTNQRPAQLQQTGPLLAGAELTAASSPRFNNFNNFTLYIFSFLYFTFTFISSLRLLISRIMVYC